jgi:antitoxin (DNA-binding transcriptional repressor) of toxin-antitoxin stability system
VGRAAAGEEIVITRHGKPLAKLVPISVTARESRKPSGLPKIKGISPDFDDPLPPELLKQFGDDS